MHRLLLAAVAGSALLIPSVGITADSAAPDAGASAVAPPPIPPPPIPPPPVAAAVDKIGGARQLPPNGAPIHLEVGKGTLIHLPAPANTVFVADAGIADVTVKTPSLVYVTAKKPGETALYAVDAEDRVLLNSLVYVEHDLSKLRDGFAHLMPGERISVSSVNGDILLTGVVTTAGQAHKAAQLVAAILGENVEVAAAGAAVGGAAAGGGGGVGPTGGTKIINQLVVATPNQINLRVRIAQVKTDILKDLGITLTETTKGSKTTFSFTPAPAITTGTQNLATLFQTINKNSSITAVLNALVTEGLATNLAEPNLTALSGEKASFKVGGSITIPGALTPVVSTGTAVASTTTSGTQQLGFGIRLDFTATIIDANHITLKLRPEVSVLNFADATTINGTVIPGVDETIAETTVELGSGESFALAGLLQHNTNNKYSKTAGLGDIPVVGALFRSNEFTRNDTELVIVVTPYIVQPVATAVATPNDGHKAPHDLSRFLNSATYRPELPPPAHGPLQGGQEKAGIVGPVGFRLD